MKWDRCTHSTFQTPLYLPAPTSSETFPENIKRSRTRTQAFLLESPVFYLFFSFQQYDILTSVYQHVLSRLNCNSLFSSRSNGAFRLITSVWLNCRKLRERHVQRHRQPQVRPGVNFDTSVDFFLLFFTFSCFLFFFLQLSSSLLANIKHILCHILCV